MNLKKEPSYKDYIEYQQETVKNITIEQSELVEKYYPIIKALREKSMTVKEIHDLYYDKEKKKHEYTIKTIYRYLDELEEAGLVVVAGHRVTEGSRVLEKLYTRTAKIFYKHMDEEYQNYKREYYQKFIKNQHFILSILFEKPDLDLEEFKSALMPFYTERLKKIDKLMTEIEKHPKLAEFYSKIGIDEINYLNNDLGMILTLIDNPEIIEKLKKLLSK